MYKAIILSIFVAILIGILFLASNLTDAYKVLPGSTSSSELTVAPYADWREFIPQSEKFKVDLPAVPQYAKEAVNIPHTDKKRLYEMYAAEKINGPVFMISVISYPADFDLSNKTETLRSIIDELAASNVNNHLSDVKEETFQNYPALDFQMINKEFDIQGKLFMVDRVAYVLTYVAKNTDFSQDDYQHFLQSFRLLPSVKKQDESA